MTRSWNEHVPSVVVVQTQDFTKKNKLSIEAGANDPSKHKEFIKNLDIKKEQKYIAKQKYIDLPPDDFTYGMPVRVHTPMKDIINNYYANKAEEEVKKSYEAFFEEKSKAKKLVIKKTPHFKKMVELKKNAPAKGQEEKPLYKLKMFQNVGSRVTEGIKKFKTYNNKNNLIKKEGDTGLGDMIQQVQEEIKVNEQAAQP